MVSLKSDASQIKGFLEGLAEQDWVKRSERRWWPQFVFHYTDIRNAVEIVRKGYLYSRAFLEANNRLPVSSGSSRVLAGTDTVIKDCARLYFRPKTPTQYYAEGIHSQATLSASRFPDAHCPVPVFFLFDSTEILSRTDCWFSDGNLGSSRAQIFSTAAELERLPWRKIYHTGWFDHSDPDNYDIAYRRCAELIIPRRLDLNALHYIYCRSKAERETLLNLLPSALRKRYQDKIVASTRSSLFFRQRTFIETVRLTSGGAYIQFSPDTGSLGPFQLLIEIETEGHQSYLEVKDFMVGPNFKKKVPVSASSYTMRLNLDRHLAYANKYRDMEIPF